MENQFDRLYVQSYLNMFLGWPSHDWKQYAYRKYSLNLNGWIIHHLNMLSSTVCSTCFQWCQCHKTPCTSSHFVPFQFTSPHASWSFIVLQSKFIFFSWIVCPLYSPFYDLLYLAGSDLWSIPKYLNYGWMDCHEPWTFISPIGWIAINLVIPWLFIYHHPPDIFNCPN